MKKPAINGMLLSTAATAAGSVLLLIFAACACAQTSSNPVVAYFEDWFPRVTRIQSEQPRWVTPLVTVTPRLEEEVRYDQFFQSLPG